MASQSIPVLNVFGDANMMFRADVPGNMPIVPFVESQRAMMANRLSKALEVPISPENLDVRPFPQVSAAERLDSVGKQGMALVYTLKDVPMGSPDIPKWGTQEYAESIKNRNSRKKKSKSKGKTVAEEGKEEDETEKDAEQSRVQDMEKRIEELEKGRAEDQKKHQVQESEHNEATERYQARIQNLESKLRDLQNGMRQLFDDGSN